MGTYSDLNTCMLEEEMFVSVLEAKKIASLRVDKKLNLKTTQIAYVMLLMWWDSALAREQEFKNDLHHTLLFV